MRFVGVIPASGRLGAAACTNYLTKVYKPTIPVNSHCTEYIQTSNMYKIAIVVREKIQEKKRKKCFQSYKILIFHPKIFQVCLAAAVSAEADADAALLYGAYGYTGLAGAYPYAYGAYAYPYAYGGYGYPYAYGLYGK